MTQHQGLFAGYAAAAVGWFIALRIWPGLWPKPGAMRFARPWRELVYALAAAVCVIGLGQLWHQGWRLTATGSLAPFAGAINHALIFSPFPILLLIRGHTLDTAWLPMNRVGSRIAVGLGLAATALVTFCVARGEPGSLFERAKSMFQFRHVEHLSQVFFEDFAIAVLMVRLTAAFRRPWLAAIFVGGLFAGGHIPSMLANGAAMADFLRLGLDFLLATGVVMVVQRSADIWWLWCVHFVMDMTQF